MLSIQYGTISAAAEIRVRQPFERLNLAGWQTAAIFPHDFHKMTAEMFAFYDILLLQHSNAVDPDRWNRARALAQAAGKAIVYDVADDILHPRNWNYNEQAAKTVEYVLATVDAVTVATPYLAERVRPINPNVYILPNCVDAGAFCKEKLGDDITIGLMGGNSHHEDWKLVSEALHRIAKERDDVWFYVLGYLPYYLRDLPNLIWEEWVPYQEFPEKLRNIHIGLAPVSGEDDYNLGKSALKAIDYMASGAVALVSDHPIYRQVGGCIRVKDDEWHERITDILNDHERRKKLMKRGPKWVRRNRDINKLWTLWADIYIKIWRTKWLQQSNRTSVLPSRPVSLPWVALTPR